MSDLKIWAVLIIGVVVGALAALLWRARREQALRIEAELMRARLKTEEMLSAEREQTLVRARDQLQGVFGELARESLQSNSEVFLQLARERFTRQQLDASQVLKERESAIESLVKPIRDALAKTESQIQAIERDRIDSFATIKVQMEVLASGQSLLSRETRNLVTALRRPDVRGQWGEITLRRLVELSGMTLHVDFTEQQHVKTDNGSFTCPSSATSWWMSRLRSRLISRRWKLRTRRSAAPNCAAMRRSSVRGFANCPRSNIGRNSSAVRISSCCSCPAINSYRRRCRKIPA
jgi:gas vesicle protein